MFDIKKTLDNFGLTEQDYENFLKDCSDKVNKISDLDWSEICEKYSIPWNGDSLRKGNITLVGGSFVKQYYEEKMAKEKSTHEDQYLKELEEKKLEIKRETVKLRDQRNAINRGEYINARVEEKLDLLEEKLQELGKYNFSNHPYPVVNSNNEMIIMLADLHIGQTFDSAFGKYDSDIAKNRLNEYLNKSIKIGKKHHIKRVHVVGLGDAVNGSIHRTIQITNKENVIEQVKLATELISSFCYELTKEFEDVYFYNTVGNHERLDKKEEALHDERLGDIVSWAVELSLKHINNFHCLAHRKLDIGIIDINVCGKTYIAIHGDNDTMSKQGIANLCMMLGFIPYCILRGHNHYPAYSEMNGVMTVQSGSLVGSGDSYCIEQRSTGRPSQTILVCNKDGIECIYNVDLA